MPQDENDEQEIIEFYEETLGKLEIATQKISDCNKKINDAEFWNKIPLETKNSSIGKLKLEIKQWEEEQKDLLKTIEFIKEDLPNVEEKLTIQQKTKSEKKLLPKEIKEFKKPTGFWGGVFNKFTKTINFLKTDAPKSAEDLKEKMNEELEIFEKRATKNGVNFSRCNMENIAKAYKEGKIIEFELYQDSMVIEEVFRKMLPKAKMITENSKNKNVEQLVKKLEEKNNIKKKNGIIYFSNPESENPEYKEIILQTSDGKWTSEGLNASTYLKPENLEITHLVVFPNSLKKEQDKTWEILRILGIEPTNYHDIFFDENVLPEKIAETIGEEIEKNIQITNSP